MTGQFNIGCEFLTFWKQAQKYEFLDNLTDETSYLNDVKALETKLKALDRINEHISIGYPCSQDGEPDDLSDVEIYCEEEGKTFRCHKWLLSVRSKVFKSYFSHDTREMQENRIIIKDISSETIEALLHFIYTDNVGEDVITPELMEAAERYDIQRLKTMCEKSLIGKINTSNSLELWVIANRNHTTILEQVLIRFIANNWPKVQECALFKDIVKEHPDLQGSVISYLRSACKH